MVASATSAAHSAISGSWAAFIRALYWRAMERLAPSTAHRMARMAPSIRAERVPGPEVDAELVKQIILLHRFRAWWTTEVPQSRLGIPARHGAGRHPLVPS